MTCRELSDFLDCYRDGDFAAGTNRHFAEHLRRCRACAEYSATYETTIRLARVACSGESTPAPLPEELVLSILAGRRGRARSSIPALRFLD